MKVRDVWKIVETDGWEYTYSTGSHHHFYHPTKSGKVTIPGHRSDELAPKTLVSILKQAGLR